MRECVEYIGQHQFLMLLLVIETDLDQRRDFGERTLAGLLKESHHSGIDMAAVFSDLTGAGTGQVTSLMAGVARTGADIVGIE